MSETKSPPTDLNLSLAAGSIVSNAVQAVRHLFCPFCGESSLFEHTLKAHLKAMHPDRLQNYAHFIGTNRASSMGLIDNDFEKKMSCTFCGAVFVHVELLAKHIAAHHGSMCLNVWHQQQREQSEQNKDSEKLVEPTILYAHCSPGLSDLFDKISTNDNDGVRSPLKSILKKSNAKSAAHRIICSPSSAGIRRTKNTSALVRRTSSARRELRFDVADENQPLADCEMPPMKIARDQLQAKKRRRHGYLMGLFGRCVSSRKRKSPRRIITSTPNNFLDECDATANLMGGIVANDKKWRTIIHGSERNRPLFSLLERFQCAHCKSAWENNADLLTHLNEKHKNIRRWFQADYRCGTCAATFYSNRFLVRHCHAHHTPVKRLR